LSEMPPLRAGAISKFFSLSCSLILCLSLLNLTTICFTAEAGDTNERKWPWDQDRAQLASASPQIDLGEIRNEGEENSFIGEGKKIVERVVGGESATNSKKKSSRTADEKN